MEAVCVGMSLGLGPKLDLDAAAAENRAFMSTRTGERKEMVALNDRLAVYIEKARPFCSLSPCLSLSPCSLPFKFVYLSFIHIHSIQEQNGVSPRC